MEPNKVYVGKIDEFELSFCKSYHYKRIEVEKEDKTLKILVLKYDDKLSAVDADCPHQGYPLQFGKLVDIEDFGVKFGKAIKCPAHFWCFDLYSGKCDRTPHNLKVYQTYDEEGEIYINDIPIDFKH